MSEKKRKDGVPLKDRMREGSAIRANISTYHINQQTKPPLTEEEMKDLMERVRQNSIPIREDSEEL